MAFLDVVDPTRKLSTSDSIVVSEKSSFLSSDSSTSNLPVITHYEEGTCFGRKDSCAAHDMDGC
jgi:hypothetical protein